MACVQFEKASNSGSGASAVSLPMVLSDVGNSRATSIPSPPKMRAPPRCLQLPNRVISEAEFLRLALNENICDDKTLQKAALQLEYTPDSTHESLLWAIHKGNVPLVRILLQRGAQVRDAHAVLQTVFKIRFQNKQLAMMRALRTRIDPSHALFLAIDFDHLDMGQHLVLQMNGRDLGAHLFKVVQMRHLKTVRWLRLLFRYGAQIPEGLEQSLLMYYLKTHTTCPGGLEIAILLENGSMLSPQEWKTLWKKGLNKLSFYHLATLFEEFPTLLYTFHLSFLRGLGLDAKRNYRFKEWTTQWAAHHVVHAKLFKHALRGNYPCLLPLLHQNPQLNLNVLLPMDESMELHSALEVAVLSNRIECVKILVAWGVSPRHSLVYAVKLGHLHILRVILEGRVDTKLLAHVHTCVKHEEWFHDNQQARECLDLLVKTANPPEGTIHFAISRDNPFVVSCLPSEPTPRMLQVAIKHGCVRTMEILLERMDMPSWSSEDASLIVFNHCQGKSLDVWYTMIRFSGLMWD